MFKAEDGVDVVYSVAQRKRGHKEPTLITVFRDDTRKCGISEKRKPPKSSKTVNPHHSGKTARGDTAEGQTAYTPRSQEANQLAGKTNVLPSRPVVNFSVETPDAFTPALALCEEIVAPEDRKALLAAQEQDIRVLEYDDMG